MLQNAEHMYNVATVYRYILPGNLEWIAIHGQMLESAQNWSPHGIQLCFCMYALITHGMQEFLSPYFSIHLFYPSLTGCQSISSCHCVILVFGHKTVLRSFTETILHLIDASVFIYQRCQVYHRLIEEIFFPSVILILSEHIFSGGCCSPWPIAPHIGTAAWSSPGRYLHSGVEAWSSTWRHDSRIHGSRVATVIMAKWWP